MNKIRRLAEELVTRYPTLFTSNFDKNKVALSQVSIIHARSLRNQLAGAITRLVQDQGPAEGEETRKELTLGEQIMAEVEQESQKNPEQMSAKSPEEPKQETPPTQ